MSVELVSVSVSGIFPEGLKIFRPNFTDLLQVPIYARLQLFVQLPATLTKLCKNVGLV